MKRYIVVAGVLPLVACQTAPSGDPDVAGAAPFQGSESDPAEVTEAAAPPAEDPVCLNVRTVAADQDVTVDAYVDAVYTRAYGAAQVMTIDPAEVADRCANGGTFGTDAIGLDDGTPHHTYGGGEAPGEPIPAEYLADGTAVWVIVALQPDFHAILLPSAGSQLTEVEVDSP